mmetsp:Transcript_23434/g.43521  ORF Transcript_23434/g.43521 Transcript_23434/m.43521 type:complete len:345 (+) Transcript_23434:2-1036(+)
MGITEWMFHDVSPHGQASTGKLPAAGPDGVERALFAISMGSKAADSNIVERFVWSAVNIGQYDGWIVVLTDAPSGRYDVLSNWTDKAIVMRPEEEDIKTHYETANMKYKRFKTLVLDYVQRDSRLDNVELVYYLDVDIVFGYSIWSLFKGLEESYRIGAEYSNSSQVGKSKALGKMWMFQGNSNKWKIQGGQMILDRRQSQPCLDKWRELFDRNSTQSIEKDQWLLMEMLEAQNNATKTRDYSSLACEFVIMAQKPFIDFPTATYIKRKSRYLKRHKRKSLKHAPLVHIRNDGNTNHLPEKDMMGFMMDVLQFQSTTEDVHGLLKKPCMEVTEEKNTNTTESAE